MHLGHVVVVSCTAIAAKVVFFLKRVSACVSCNREVVEEEEEEGARIISVQNVLFHVRSMS